MSISLPQKYVSLSVPERPCHAWLIFLKWVWKSRYRHVAARRVLWVIYLWYSMLHWRCAGQLNLKLKLGILSFFSADQNNHKPAYHRYLFELPIIKNVLHLRKSGYMEKAPRDRQQNYQHLWFVPVNPADQKEPVKAAHKTTTEQHQREVTLLI